MIWTGESIKTMLETNDKAVARAVMALYQRQTADEQSSEETKHHNSVGFNAADARYLSYCATYAQRSGRLTGKHLIKARSKVIKYREQLANIANENEKRKKESPRSTQQTKYGRW